MPRYDKSTETTVTGIIEDLIQMSGNVPGRIPSTHLTLKSGAETLQVHLGPSWYLDEKQSTRS